MTTLTKKVFEKVEKPEVNSQESEALPKGKQLQLINAYKEYELEMKVYNKVKETGKSVNEVFYNDAEIDIYKQDLAKSRFAMLKVIGKSESS